MCEDGAKSRDAERRLRQSDSLLRCRSDEPGVHAVRLRIDHRMSSAVCIDLHVCRWCNQIRRPGSVIVCGARPRNSLSGTGRAFGFMQSLVSFVIDIVVLVSVL